MAVVVQVQHAREAQRPQGSVQAQGPHHGWVVRMVGLGVGGRALLVSAGCATPLRRSVERVCVKLGPLTHTLHAHAHALALLSPTAGMHQLNDSQLLTTAADGRLMVWDLRQAQAPVKFCIPDTK